MVPDTDTGRSPQGSTLSACGISIDTDLFDACAGGRRIPLTSREYDVLLLLLRESYRVTPRLEIKRLVWGSAAVGERVVDTYICRLRKKLLEVGHPGISVLQKRGYRLLSSEVDEAVLA